MNKSVVSSVHESDLSVCSHYTPNSFTRNNGPYITIYIYMFKEKRVTPLIINKDTVTEDKSAASGL